MNITSRQFLGGFPTILVCVSFVVVCVVFYPGSHLSLVGLFFSYDVSLLFSWHLHLVVQLAYCDNGKIFVACIFSAWIS